MKTKATLLIAAIALLAVPAAAQNRPALPKEIKDALVEALAGKDGEYAARATYDAVLKKYGNVQPYANLIRAEGRHINALKRQMQKYGVAIPKDTFMGKVKAPVSLKEAAMEGVAGEMKNVAMFDELLPKVKQYPDLHRVFTNSVSYTHLTLPTKIV